MRGRACRWIAIAKRAFERNEMIKGTAADGKIKARGGRQETCKEGAKDGKMAKDAGIGEAMGMQVAEHRAIEAGGTDGVAAGHPDPIASREKEPTDALVRRDD